MRALLRVAATAALWCFLVVAFASVHGLAAPGPAKVGKSDLRPLAGSSPSPELMRALMAWAAPRLDLPVPDELPVIVRKDHCGLQAIAYPGRACLDEGRGVLALYGSGVMWLRDDWSADSLKDVSILLHELVHHMQHHAGVEAVPCKAEALEKPAYDAQFAFLEAAGVDPYETVGINALMLIFVTNCMSRY
jgi:hypothetical protein